MRNDYSAGSLLTAVVLAAIVPFLLVGSFLVVAFVRAEREEALQRVPALAASLSASVDRKLSSYIGNLNALSSAFQASGDSVERFTSVAKAGARALGGSVVLLDRAGQQRINTASASTSTLPQTADLGGLKRVFEAGKPDIGDLVHGTIHSRMIFSARIPILIDGSIRYSLEYVPSAKDLVATVEEMALPRGWFAAVLDRQGNIVARSYRHEDFYGMSAGNAFLSRLTVPAGLLDSVDLEGRKTVTAYQRSAFSGWYSLVWVSKDVLDEKANTAQWVLVGLTAFTLAVSLLVGYLVSHLIRSPTRGLVDAAKALGAGQEVHFSRSLMREANLVGNALIDASQDVRIYLLEISHRSKNLLAVILSLARQTLRNAETLQQFEQRFGDRLQSLAYSHDALIERNWAGVMLTDLIRVQLRSFVEDGDSRVEMAGEPVLLSPPSAQHLGLAFHELATNSAKYGALSVLRGGVHISWTTMNDEAGECFELTWAEHGGPKVPQPTRKGFGSVVLEQAVPRSIGGLADLQWKSDGLEWTLRVPLARLVSDGRFDFGRPSSLPDR